MQRTNLEDPLSIEIQQFYDRTVAGDEDVRTWREIVDELTRLLRQKIPNIKLALVGSCGSGLASKSSDLDIVAKTANYISVTNLGSVLRASSFCRNLKVITGAKVPIVTFQERRSGRDCDISINNLNSLWSCYLLKAYGELDPRVRPLTMFIVKWAKDKDIIGAKYHKLASFVLKMMIINYLQVGCFPTVLISLQLRYPQHFQKTYSKDIEKMLQAPMPPEVLEFRSANTESLSSLLQGFFRYYSSFQWNSKKISVRDGAVKFWHPFSDRGKGDICLYVECPYSQENAARSVFRAYVFRQITDAFRSAAQRYS